MCWIFAGPFAHAMSSSGAPSSGTSVPPPTPTTALHVEPWFHGSMSRKESEQLLTQDGDFLVRESSSTKGQFVLSGLQDGQFKHLLLVDPNGVVSIKLYCDHRTELQIILGVCLML